MWSMQIATLLVLSRLPLSSSHFPPISFHPLLQCLSHWRWHCWDKKSYTVIHSEDIYRQSKDYSPRTPFLFLINYPKQICKVLRNFLCTAQYPLNQTPPTGWTWGKLRLKKPTQSDVSQVIRLQVGEKIVFIRLTTVRLKFKTFVVLIPHRRARGMIKPLKIKESCDWIQYLLIMLTVACYMGDRHVLLDNMPRAKRPDI